MVEHPLTHQAAADTDDVQGLVLQGYGRLRAATYLLVRFGGGRAMAGDADGPGARAWLAGPLPEVTRGAGRPAGTAVNVALTAEGLGRLGLPAVTTAGFSPEFLEGMTSAHRSRLLGDAGAAAPEAWAWGGPGTPRVDALLLLFAGDEDTLAGLLATHRDLLAAHGLVEVGALETRDIGFNEHFGFRDGLSQPVLAGNGAAPTDQHTVEAGEFLLGHRNAHGQYPRSPLVPADLDPDGLLPAAPRSTDGATPPVPPGLQGAHDLGRNGSYLVVRTLRQDVGAFWRYADQQARSNGGPADTSARTAVAARMVGRWPGGAPLTMSPDADRPDLAEANDFTYHADDRAGLRCPIGAHVRRTNPRDSLPPEPGTAASVEVGKRHRLIRRGRAYGPPVTPDEAMLEDAETAPERGLHFLALCADIARQFEFVSHTWAMDPHFAGLYDDADPLLGGHTGRGTSFTIQARPVRRRLTDVPVFVTPRGGAYFFLPSGSALRFLARP